MRPGARLLVACCLLLPVCSLSLPSDAASGGQIVQLPTVPEGVASVTDLTCPSAILCVGVSSPMAGGQAIAVGTGDRSTWSVTELPHPNGTDVLVAGLSCPTVGLCMAWGSAGAATVWVTTSPASGGWQRQVLGTYPNPGQVNDVDCGATLCVAVSDAWVNGESLGGFAWVSQDLLAGSWSSSPLDAAYRTFQLSCVEAMCVATGQSKTDFYVNASVWSTPDALAGTWTRTEPSAYPYDVDGLSAIHCLTASLCTANAVVATADGATIYARRGYFTSTSPTTGVWDWHIIQPYYLGIGPLFCAQVGECLMYDGNNLWADPDPTDEDVQPTPVPIQHQNYLALRGFSCFDASTCQVWGSDSGGASAGPLMATRVWRGPASGAGAWSAAALPLPAGHGDQVPTAGDLACSRPHLHGGRRAQLGELPVRGHSRPGRVDRRCRRRVAGGGGGYGWHRRWRRWFDGHQGDHQGHPGDQDHPRADAPRRQGQGRRRLPEGTARQGARKGRPPGRQREVRP